MLEPLLLVRYLDPFGDAPNDSDALRFSAFESDEIEAGSNMEASIIAPRSKGR